MTIPAAELPLTAAGVYPLAFELRKRTWWRSSMTTVWRMPDGLR